MNSVERKMAEEVVIATLDLTETQEMEVDEFFEEDVSDDDDEEYLPASEGKAPELFDQEELNDVVRKLGLPKDGAEYFASLLKKKNLLTKGTKHTRVKKWNIYSIYNRNCRHFDVNRHCSFQWDGFEFRPLSLRHDKPLRSIPP
ncbi:hypothetical protein QAD02_012676 [Eretmocerus hayati]|uniref:Uncharacterized protein n=1 Tax=Eretmocerus hayati TaxID=131215 RepID=A0ACC2P0M5_9HYME|nr:hypothetical protein QAD02_012676 [Eretmocerus hayati]